MNLHLVKFLLFLLVAGSLTTAYNSMAADSTNTTLGITVLGEAPPEEEGGGGGGGGKLPPEEGEEGEELPEEPGQGISPTVFDFQPKSIINRYGYTIRVYGQDLTPESKVVIGYLQFASTLRIEDGRQVLSADISRFALAPGSYRIGAINPGGQLHTVEGFMVVEGVFDAEFVSKSPNPVIDHDGIGSVSVTYRNTGNLVWLKDDYFPVRLGTARPRDRKSNFRNEAWVLDDRPASLYQDVVLPGQEGTFVFSLKPSFRTFGRTTREYFGMVSEHDTWFGPEVFWDVTVKPGPSLFDRAVAAIGYINSSIQYFTHTMVQDSPAQQPETTVYASDPLTGSLERVYQTLRSVATLGR